MHIPLNPRPIERWRYGHFVINSSHGILTQSESPVALMVLTIIDQNRTVQQMCNDYTSAIFSILLISFQPLRFYIVSSVAYEEETRKSYHAIAHPARVNSNQSRIVLSTKTTLSHRLVVCKTPIRCFRIAQVFVPKTKQPLPPSRASHSPCSLLLFIRRLIGLVSSFPYLSAAEFHT